LDSSDDDACELNFVISTHGARAQGLLTIQSSASIRAILYDNVSNCSTSDNLTYSLNRSTPTEWDSVVRIGTTPVLDHNVSGCTVMETWYSTGGIVSSENKKSFWVLNSQTTYDLRVITHSGGLNDIVVSYTWNEW